MYTYEDILNFAESQHITTLPFKQVIQLYDKEVADIINDAYADQLIDMQKVYYGYD